MLKEHMNTKTFAWIMIGFLIVADFFSIFLMFRDNEAQTDFISSFIFAWTFALCLEGFPTICGSLLGNIITKIKLKENDFKYSILGFIFAFIGTLLVIILVFVLRGIQIESRGGYEAYIAGSMQDFSVDLGNAYYLTKPSQYILDRFLQMSPILTSVLALCISWKWLRTDKIDEQKNKKDRLHRRLVHQITKQEDALHKFENARVKLWTLVCSDKKMPVNPSVYRYEIFNRIREHLYHNCMDILDTEMTTYNAEMEVLLQSYITALSKQSSIPDDILLLKLSDVIEKYDANKDDMNKWDYKKAGPVIHDQINNSLNRNAVYVEKNLDMKN
ncbi:hypothetical protein [uncultured Thomasclavelia sp.]|uniref:hypothetical protein n=1 Tax=uncultured Thomasclavelia sp. TaxID=3025759 RepID=UPI0025DA2461|nr:hypothetical protein [uncultured Thomasclavelia sp.]